MGQVWQEAFLSGFARCQDGLASSGAEGGCGAMVCAIARSGTYVCSIGLGRVVVGTETDGGFTVLCDAGNHF